MTSIVNILQLLIDLVLSVLFVMSIRYVQFDEKRKRQQIESLQNRVDELERLNAGDLK